MILVFIICDFSLSFCLSRYDIPVTEILLMLALITNQSNHSIKKNIQLVQKYINLQKQTFGLVLIFLAFMTH